MPSWLRRRVTYANVMSTLAVFIALGGSSYAAYSINGANVKNRSIAARKLKRNTLTGREIKESTLATVRHARNADTLDGRSADDLAIGCPPDTFLAAGVCVERTPRPATPYGSAVLICGHLAASAGPGRRLPTHNELLAAVDGNEAAQFSPGGELTAEVYPSSAHPGELDDLYMTNPSGYVALTPDRAEGAKPYRCVTPLY